MTTPASRSIPTAPYPHGLTESDIEEFRRLRKEEFKEEISEGDAGVRVNQVLELYLHISKSKPADQEASPGTLI